MDHAEEIEFHIREQTFPARMAAFVLGGEKVAIVLDDTIHLHGTKEAELLGSTRWLRHELMHVQQYRRHGRFTFLIRYLLESLWKGYRKIVMKLKRGKPKGYRILKKNLKWLAEGGADD